MSIFLKGHRSYYTERFFLDYELIRKTKRGGKKHDLTLVLYPLALGISPLSRRPLPSSIHTCYLLFVQKWLMRFQILYQTLAMIENKIPRHIQDIKILKGLCFGPRAGSRPVQQQQVGSTATGWFNSNRLVQQEQVGSPVQQAGSTGRFNSNRFNSNRFNSNRLVQQEQVGSTVQQAGSTATGSTAGRFNSRQVRSTAVAGN